MNRSPRRVDRIRAPGATRDLTRVGLTLAPPPALGTRARRYALVVAAVRGRPRRRRAAARARCAAVVVRARARRRAELVQLRQQLRAERAMGLRVADARSQELEQQIDALNQKLTENRRTS